MKAKPKKMTIERLAEISQGEFLRIEKKVDDGFTTVNHELISLNKKMENGFDTIANSIDRLKVGITK